MRWQSIRPYGRGMSKHAGRHVALAAVVALAAAPLGLIAVWLIEVGLTPVDVADPWVACSPEHFRPCRSGPVFAAVVGGVWLTALLSAAAAIPLTLAHRASDLARQTVLILPTAAVVLAVATGGLRAVIG